MLRSKISVLFSLFVIFAGCARQAPVSVFDHVPDGRTTASTSRFLVIDDFNAGVGKSRLGTEWKIREMGPEKLRLFPEREDAVKHGGSLGIGYTLGPRQTAAVFASLNGLDASKAEFVVLLIRKKELEAFSGKLGVSLRDVTGRDITVDLKKWMRRIRSGPVGEWIEVSIPRSAFQTLDFNELERFEIALITSGEPAKGNLAIDEIAFFGPEEIVFESDRDNLAGFPEEEINEARLKELLKIKDDKQFLSEIARDTWRYFESLIDRETHLVVDHIRLGAGPGVGSYVSPTNIALYWIVNVAAYDLSLISKEQATTNIQLSLETLEKLSQWGKGFRFNFYHTRNLRVTRQYVSVVDNGWLAAGLVVIRQAFPEAFGEKATKFLNGLDFYEFYDSSNGQLKLGFEVDKGKFSPYHYGLLATEARLTSYIAIGKGDLENEHWARIYRTLPVEWDWQKQIPQGSERALFDLPVFEGSYTYLNREFVPSWGGSLFEFLAPTLILKEQELAPEGLGKNNEIVTDLHIEHALRVKGHPVWGMAPCAVRNGKYWIYREYGVPDLGAKGYSDRGVIAPYASFLALATRPKAAIENLRKMLSLYPDLYGEYGIYDSVDVAKGIVNHQYLALDQGMSFVATANYVKDGVIRNRFHSDEIGKKAEALLKEETFSVK